MSFIENFEDQLVQAAREQRDARLRYRIRRFVRKYLSGRRGPAVILAALLVGVPAATATITNWNPFDDAGRHPHFPPPTISQRPIDRELVEMLGVLRRPQTDADRGAPTATAARRFFSPQNEGAHPEGIRLLDPERGVVLVPFDRDRVPSDEQGRPMPGFDQSKFDNVVCLYLPNPAGIPGGGGSCYSAERIRSGRSLPSVLAGENSRISGLVPDGVARVRLIRGDVSVEAPVNDNFFTAGRRAPMAPDYVEWLRADGSIIRRFDMNKPPPNP
jgi:hypothetical protein